jgi:hypothetical protein
VGTWSRRLEGRAGPGVCRASGIADGGAASCPAMSGRSSTPVEREARAKRILAAAERGETTAAIADREGISPRQVRRVLERHAALAHDGPDDLPVVDVLEIDPFGELGRCIAAHRESIGRLRSVARQSRNDAVVVGAAKASAALSGELVALLVSSGLLPQAAFQWRAELQWRTAWEALVASLSEAGIDEDAFLNEVERRLKRGRVTDVGLVELGPDPAPLEAAAA